MFDEEFDEIKEKIEYQLDSFRSRLRELESENNRLGEIIKKNKEQIAQMRQAVQPILESDSQDPAILKSKAEMAKDLDKFHADYHICARAWEEGMVRDLCYINDPIFDLVITDNITREELLKAVVESKERLKKKEAEFARIGARRKKLRETMEKLGEW